MVVFDPENTFKIDSVWVFVSRDENGNEGVMAFHNSVGMMPMLTTDEEMVESLKPIAKEMAKHTSKKIHLVKMTSRVEMGEIT